MTSSLSDSNHPGSGNFSLALVEAKGSARSDPKHLLNKNAHQFLVDVKTRATGFAYNYEGYLICCNFQDGRHVECAILRADLACFNTVRATSVPIDPFPGFDPTVPSYENPDARLQAIIRVQASTSAAQDEYLTTILSEEASRSATLALIKKGTAPEKASHVDAYPSAIGATPTMNALYPHHSTGHAD
jgi:hypothetical protein